MIVTEGNGWVKIYRELLDKPIWQLSSPEQKTILVTLLLMAWHKGNKWEWNGGQYECEPGQFVTSLEHIAIKSGQGVSIQNVRTAIKRFEKLNFLTNKSTKTGRLITIVNWGHYQELDDEVSKEPNKHLTNTSQRANKDLTPNKNVKNDKNVKNIKDNVPPAFFDSFWSAYPKQKEKTRAMKCFAARIKDGYPAEVLVACAKVYAEECEAMNQEERFIKYPATFLGINKPFEDYISKINLNQTGTEQKAADLERRILE